MDVPFQILDRNKHLQEDKLVFGKINYWSMCKKLKTVMMLGNKLNASFKNLQTA